MPTVNVKFDGDASGAVAAKQEAQAAIDSLTGKTVRLRIQVDNVGGLRDAAAGMNNYAQASDRAATAARDHAAASERATTAVRAHTNEVDRSTRSLRDHAAASVDASRAMNSLGSPSSGGGSGMGRMAQDTQRATSALGGFTRGADRATGASRGLFSQLKQDFWSGAATELKSIADQHEAAGTSFQTTGVKAAAGASFLRRMAVSAGDADSSSRALGSTVSGLGGTLVGAGVGAGTAARGAMGLGGAVATAVGVAAVGAGLFTTAVGGLGAVGVASLGAVGAAAGLAGAGMVAFTLDAQKDSEKFGAKLEHLGQQAHLAAQTISDPMAESIVGLGAALVSTDSKLTPAGRSIQNSLKDGFATAAGVIDESSGSIVESGVRGAAGFAKLTSEAAPGVKAFLSQLPDLTSGAVAGLSQVTSEFGAQAGAIERATPSINRMVASFGGLGAELVRVGGANLAPFATDVASMTDGVTGMIQGLAPAIRPSMGAVTSVVNAVTGALGSPEVASATKRFADTITENAPAIQDVVKGVTTGAVGASTVTVPAITHGARALVAPRTSPVGQGGEVPVGNLRPDPKGYEGQSFPEKLWHGLTDILSGTPVELGQSPLAGTQPSIGAGGGAPGGHAGPLSKKIPESMRQGLGLPATPTGPGFSEPVGSSAELRSLTGAPGPVAPAAGSPAASMEARLGAAPGMPSSAGPGQVFGGLFTGAAQSAQQGAQAIPQAMQSAMQQSQQAVANTNLGGAVQPQMQRMTQSVQSAAPAAATAGASVGAAVGEGIAQGTTTSITVIDKVIVKHVQHIEHQYMKELDAQSPSKRFRPVGATIPMGMAGGVEDEASAPLAATSTLLDGMQSRANAAKPVNKNAPVARQDEVLPVGKSRTALLHAQQEQDRRRASSARRAQEREQIAAGQNSGNGFLGGLNSRMGAANRAGAYLADAAHRGYKRQDEQSSPSKKWAGFASNSVDGLAGGFATSTSTATGAVTSMAGTMQGVADDASLKMGYRFARNVVTGADTVFKSSDFQAAGAPSLENEQVRTALGSAGKLGPAVGASVYKASAVGFDMAGMVAQIGAAVAAAIVSQPVQVGVNLDGTPFYAMVAEAQNRLVERWAEAAA